MPDVTYGGARGTSPKELKQFYTRPKHDVDADAEHFRRMIKTRAAFVTARVDGQLVGVSRGVCDGVRGYLTECKLDPAYQGPAAVTRTDGRVEHDSFGIAAEMARRVLDKLVEQFLHAEIGNCRAEENRRLPGCQVAIDRELWACAFNQFDFLTETGGIIAEQFPGLGRAQFVDNRYR